MKKEMIIKSWVMVGIFVLLISFASSFAVSSMYWEERPIPVKPGETVDFFVVLQNIAGDGGDVNVQGLISEGGDIARLTGESDVYFVPFGEKVNVNMSVTAPEDAVVGNVTYIIVSFKIIGDGDGGQFGFGSSIEREVPVKIVSDGEEVESVAFSNYIYYLVGLLILILVVIIYAFAKKRR